MSGRGLDAALVSADAVVDVSDLKTHRAAASRSCFCRSTENLLAAGQRAAIVHHVVLSIVGVDQVELGYYVGTRAQEQLVLEAGSVGTVLRATQFHESAGQWVTACPDRWLSSLACS